MGFNETEIGGSGRSFPSTQWTVIHKTQGDSDVAKTALSDLLGLYWKPIYVTVRAKGHENETAKDITQEFILHLLEQAFPKNLDRSKGRFRSYLRTALDNFLINRAEYLKAQKRGGGAHHLSLDYNSGETSYRMQVSASPTATHDIFDREWAHGIFHRSLQRLKEELEGRHGAHAFQTIQDFFQPGENPVSQQGAAKKLGMSDGQFRVLLHRARGRLRDLIKEEVQATVAEESQVTEEISELLKILTS